MEDRRKQERPSVSKELRTLIKTLVKYNASDLHLKVGRPPLFRMNGKLLPALNPACSNDQIRGLLLSLLNERQRKALTEERSVDFSFQVNDYGRFRCNIFFQQDCLSAVIRMIPIIVPRLEDLGVPDVVKDLVGRPHGLILITGATGVGKSTTLAGMIQYLNERSHVHVLTLEDPIEFLHKDLKATITQREMGSDTLSIQDGLRSGMRQDPDVIVIGELRDSELIQLSLTAAETGHLVISTLQTNDCRTTIDRLLSVFSADNQDQIRMQLANALIGVVSQQLVMGVDGKNRVLACEILVKSPAVESMLFRNELQGLNDCISGSNDYYQMQTMNQALARLVQAGAITKAEALRSSFSPEDLRLLLSEIETDHVLYNKAG